tara:strand:+ start:18 stop:401 length:384 start_codon:yes stop_codon:yes gene_type:complete
MAHRKHIKGDRAELIAAEYFISLGYSVHRNMSSHGPIDMVLIDEDGIGEVILIDVKALSLRTKNGWKVCRTPTKQQKELDVQLVFVDLDKREVLDVLPPKPHKKSKIQASNVVSLEDYKTVTRKETT